MTLGQRLRDLRTQKRMTQQELADSVGIPRSTIGMYEADHRKPRFDELDTLADYFDTSLDYLLGRSDTNYGYPRYDIQIEYPVDDYKRLEEYFKRMQTPLMFEGHRAPPSMFKILQAYGTASPEIQLAVRKLLDIKE